MKEQSIMLDDMIKHFQDGKRIAMHYPGDDEHVVYFDNRNYVKAVESDPFIGFYKEDGTKRFINTLHVKEIILE